MNIWTKRGLFPCFIFISCFWISCLLGGCNSSAVGSSMDEIDRLNGLAFKFWYKDLDSVAYYAACAERKSHACSYMDGLATAYLNRSFIAFERMDYLESVRLAELVLSMGRSQILLLRTDVLMMRLCVRTAHIESFFFYRNSAQKRMARILEDYALLKETDRADFHIARVGFHLASAAYYDTQGLTKGALDEMACIEREQLEGDTALQLAMLYVHGQIGYESDIHGQESVLRRFDDLFRSYTSARAYGYKKLEGFSVGALSEFLVHPAFADLVRRERPGWWDYLYGQFVGWYEGRTCDEIYLAEAMGRKAFECLESYGDVYGMLQAGLGLGLNAIVAGNYSKAETYLSRSFEQINNFHRRYYSDRIPQLSLLPVHDSTSTSVSALLASDVYTVPELIARLREHLSVVYSAQGNRVASDYNRNAFLDLLEGVRQDKETESRYRDLAAGRRQLYWVLMSISLTVVLWGIIFIWLFRRWNKGALIQTEMLRQAVKWCDVCLAPGTVVKYSCACGNIIPESFAHWVESSDLTLDNLALRSTRLRSEKEACEMRVTGLRRRNLEKRAKFGLVYALLPLVERLLNEVRRCRSSAEHYNLDYALDLIRKIDDDNALLAGWIQLHRGEISLHIERFELNTVFDVVRKARQAFVQRGIVFDVQPTQLTVRADRALTLFMVNTLIDNARKFTPPAGHVTVWAESGDGYVEISVADDGEGLTEEECRMLAGASVVDAGRVGHHTNDGRKGHGFGLMNCRGIIEKYRKTNALFRVCLFGVESTKGKGSRFYFRLPIGGKILVLLFLFVFRVFPLMANTEDNKYKKIENRAGQFHRPGLNLQADPNMRAAYIWADSLYFANIEGHYTDALVCADSAFSYINRFMMLAGYSVEQRLNFRSDDFLSEPVEVNWCNEGVDMDYSLLLGLRNETAIAALGCRDWLCYYYNNSVYTRLYKALGRDPQLAAYCDTMVRSQANLRVSIGVIVLIAAVGLFCFYILYFRKRMMMQLNVKQVGEISKSLTEISDLLSGEDISRQLTGMLNRLWEGINEIHIVGGIRLLLLGNEGTRYRLTSGRISDEPVADSLLDQIVGGKKRRILSGKGFTVRVLSIGLSDEEDERPIGALFFESDFKPATEMEELVDDLIIRSFTLVVYRIVWLRASEYDQIELARDERDRVRYEEDQLHVQNQVLDNCLSAIKHESMYYPSRIRQLLLQLDRSEEKDVRIRLAEDLEEVICYYKEIYTILCEQAARQLAVAQFKRRVFPLSEVFNRAEIAFGKVCRRMKVEASVKFQTTDLTVRGDEELVLFLIENLLAAALRRGESENKGQMAFGVFAEADGSFVRVTFVDQRPLYSFEEICNLFTPDMRHIWFLLCRQIIREHDVYFNHCGCRIEAEPLSAEGGVRIWFTIPKTESNI